MQVADFVKEFYNVKLVFKEEGGFLVTIVFLVQKEKIMEEKKLIEVFVTFYLRGGNATRVKVPADIDEVKLKAELRDLGYISSYRNSYRTTRVYLVDDENDWALKEICTSEHRSLEELGVVKNSLIYIEESTSQAEKYEDTDSIVSTGVISKKEGD